MFCLLASGLASLQLPILASKCSSKKLKFRLFSPLSQICFHLNNSRKSHSFLRLHFCFVLKIIHEERSWCMYRPAMLMIKLSHSYYIPTRFCLFHSTVFPIQIVFNIIWLNLICYRAVWIESKTIRFVFIFESRRVIIIHLIIILTVYTNTISCRLFSFVLLLILLGNQNGTAMDIDVTSQTKNPTVKK